MPEYQQPAATEGQGESVLTKQLGPLKTWQWGVAVGAVFLLYRWFTTGSLFGSGSSTTSTTVPFTSTGDTGSTSGGNTNGGTSGGTTTPSNPIKYITSYIAKITSRTPIYNSAGKVIGYVTKATYKLGTRIKVNGRWLYPVLSHPGWFVAAGNYIETIRTPVTTSANASVQPAVAEPATVQVMAPTTTNFSNPPFKALTTLEGSPPAIDHTSPVKTPQLAVYGTTR